MIVLVATCIFFSAVIDRVGTIPVFIAVTSKYNEQDKSRVALKTTLV